MRNFREQLKYEWSVLTRRQRVAEVLKLIAVLALAWVCFGLMGCASLPDDEAEYRDAQIMEAWNACVLLWSDQGWPWYSNRTRSAMQVKLGQPPRPLDAKREIIDNGCLRWARGQGWQL